MRRLASILIVIFILHSCEKLKRDNSYDKGIDYNNTNTSSTNNTNTTGTSTTSGTNGTNTNLSYSIKFNNYFVYSDSNHDGKINPGETINLYYSLKNNCTNNIYGISCNVSCQKSYISNINGFGDFGDFSAGVVSNGSQHVSFYVEPNAPLGVVTLFLNISSSNPSKTYNDQFNITIE